jgi:hypothetical protein
MDRKPRLLGLACSLVLGAVAASGCSHNSAPAGNTPAPVPPAVSTTVTKVPPSEKAFLDHMEQTHGGAPQRAANN